MFAHTPSLSMHSSLTEIPFSVSVERTVIRGPWFWRHTVSLLLNIVVPELLSVRLLPALSKADTSQEYVLPTARERFVAFTLVETVFIWNSTASSASTSLTSKPDILPAVSDADIETLSLSWEQLWVGELITSDEGGVVSTVNDTVSERVPASLKVQSTGKLYDVSFSSVRSM